MAHFKQYVLLYLKTIPLTPSMFIFYPNKDALTVYRIVVKENRQAYY